MKATNSPLAKSLSRLHRTQKQAFLFHPLPRQVQNGPKIHANTKSCNLRVALLFLELRTLLGGILGPDSPKTLLETTGTAAIGSRMEAHVEVTTSYIWARSKCWVGEGKKGRAAQMQNICKRMTLRPMLRTHIPIHLPPAQTNCARSHPNTSSPGCCNLRVAIVF
jgi:hypothetical protein